MALSNGVNSGVTNRVVESCRPMRDEPARGAVAIDYSSADQTFTENPRALHLSTAGTLVMDFVDGSHATLILEVGYHPLQITKIYKSGSSAAVGHVLV